MALTLMSASSTGPFISTMYATTSLRRHSRLGDAAIEPDEYSSVALLAGGEQRLESVSYKNARAMPCSKSIAGPLMLRSVLSCTVNFNNSASRDPTLPVHPKSILGSRPALPERQPLPQRPRPLEWWVPKAQQRYHEVSQ